MWLLFIAMLLIVAVYGNYNLKKNRQLAANGDVIQREEYFWENTEYLYSGATYGEVMDAINRAAFSACRVTITPNYEGSKICAFVAKGRFSAALV